MTKQIYFCRSGGRLESSAFKRLGPGFRWSDELISDSPVSIDRA